jgi:DNA-directed RNA polymerase
MLVSKLIETSQLPVTRLHPRTKEKITQMQPAFLHRVQYENGKKVGMLAANPALIEKFESEPLGSMLVKRMPMVVEPKPWAGWDKGGYIHYPNPILRLPKGDSSGKNYFLAANKRGDMGQIYAGLNALGEVPWKVHHGVFKVQLEAWNSGEGIAKFAPLHPKLDMPSQPDSQMDASAKAKWLADMQAAENKRVGLHSQRCFQNFQLETARSMINETMWFPHNLDFRGRAYPIPPYLNHMGADTVRGLLVFANGKELGPKGLTWLKIHLATVAGHDKASLSERIEFTEKHLDDIYDSVRNPLNGRRWWLRSDDPWQTLAACFELTDALDSPDPTRFVSYLPMQQDGTCNGLQHYAALGGDKIGAAQVNLEPGDRPADVYTAVAQAVIEEVHHDALQGNPIALKLDGNITRKCVKQPVMTNVYGVTFFGAKEQVQRQLEVILPNVRAYDEVNYTKMSNYIATKIFKSLGTMFSGAQAIQQWLGECADKISQSITPEQITELTTSGKSKSPQKARKKAASGKKTSRQLEANASIGGYHWENAQMRDTKSLFKTTVVWTTPLRLPVVQPYRSGGSKHVMTSMQRITLNDPQVWHPVSKRKQLQAFPPNFIHSLDATHMMLSALRCKELGITFASIHDSFWTHACDVDRMGVALRDAFVEMHKEDIIGRLREEFQTRYNGYMYFAHILLSSPAGQKITRHRKEAKLSNGEELAQEVKRLRLLRSQDPTEREEGEAMVTPASILQAEDDVSAFQVPADIANQQLGSIPSSALPGSPNVGNGESAAPEHVEPREEPGVENVALLADSVAEPETSPDAQNDSKAKTSKAGKDEKRKHPKHARKIHVWLPLTFPEVPPKGEFDIRKIKESNYFFH